MKVVIVSEDRLKQLFEMWESREDLEKAILIYGMDTELSDQKLREIAFIGDVLCL